MGWFSSVKNKIKKALKKIANIVKGAVRVVVRVVLTVVGAVLGIFDLLLGFIGWPTKKMRVQIFILSTDKGPLIDPAALAASVDFLTRTYKDKYNVKVKAYGKSMIEIIKEPAPSVALNVDCGGSAFGHEFGEAGDYFAKHLAGWNAIPISLTFPVTVFVVNNVADLGGCSLGPLTDYATCDISADGVGTASLIAHEIGHACSLWHSGTKSNLMFPSSDRGDGAKWFQKNLLRSSRHVTYW